MLLMLLACTSSQTFTHDGMERDYLLHLPEDPQGAPLLFFLHGYTGNARPYSWLGLKDLADERGFAVVFPQGSEDEGGTTHWNAQLEISDTDDLGFLSELAGHLQQEHGLDPERTFTSGISNGGFMSYALVCQRPDVFRGMASVIGTMSGETWATCPEDPVPVLQISGTDDETVPIDGSISEDGGWGGAPAMREIVDHWGEVNGCTETETPALHEDTTTILHVDCLDDAEVRYHEVEGMGHELPDFDWQGEIADFLLP